MSLKERKNAAYELMSTTKDNDEYDHIARLLDELDELEWQQSKGIYNED